MTLSREQARQAFQYLKRGVTPQEGIEYFTVGRCNELQILGGLLNETAGGASSHLFLEADYGAGKSHFLKASESAALKVGLAVSWVTIDGYNHAFNHPSRYLHSLLENLRVPTLPHRGLASLCQYWLSNGERENLFRWAVREGPSRFQQAVWSMAMGYDEDKSAALSDRSIIESRDIQFKSGRHYFSDVYARIKMVVKLCLAVGLKGCLFLFDEVECISTLLQNIRSHLISYEILCELAASRQFAHSMFIFATTPDFSRRLAEDSCMSAAYGGEYSVAVSFIDRWRRQCVNRLSLTRISRNENETLFLRLRDMHGYAYAWKPAERLADDLVRAFVEAGYRYALGEREIVKAFVNLLEVCHQHPFSIPAKELML
jgi:hypothetical protein